MRYQMNRKVEYMDFTPEQIRGIQLNILILLEEFHRICKKNNIKYSIDGGTFLGAVRHKGFIPWDSDADIVILRNDYEKFKKVCEKELDKSKYFLQDYKTDSKYRWGYSRLLLNNTRYVRAGYEHIKAKDGIFLDIFIMDNVPNHYFLRKIHFGLCYCFRKLLWSKAGMKVHKNPILRIWYSILSLIPRDFTFYILENFILINNKKKTKLIAHYCSPHPKKHKYGFPRNLFDEITVYEFEGILFSGFKNYDWYLRSIYGDYNMLPKKEDRISHIPCSELKLLDITER